MRIVYLFAPTTLTNKQITFFLLRRRRKTKKKNNSQYLYALICVEVFFMPPRPVLRTQSRLKILHFFMY